MNDFIHYFFKENKQLINDEAYEVVDDFGGCDDSFYNCQMIISNNKLDVLLTRDKAQFLIDVKSCSMGKEEWVSLGILNHIISGSKDFDEMLDGRSITYFGSHYSEICAFFEQKIDIIRKKVSSAKIKRARYLFG